MELHWTAPTRTTDGLDLTTPTTFQICRDPASEPKSPSNLPSPPMQAPCTPAVSAPASVGASSATDQLPPSLLTGASPRPLLAYRIRVLNAAGRSASPSAPVLIPAGRAVDPVVNFNAVQQKAGVVLEWQKPSDGAIVPGSMDVEILRTLFEHNGQTSRATQKPAPGPNSNPLAKDRRQKTPNEVRLRSEPIDSSAQAPNQTLGSLAGMLDQSAMQNETYTYRAQRILTVSAAGKTFELRSEPTAPITIAMRDTFPPASPRGLVTVPGGGGTTSTSPTIDLSWEANAESDLAGYIVYRIDCGVGATPVRGPSVRLTLAPLAASAYRDNTVTPGHRYEYRITAIDRSGNESGPSLPVQESPEGR